MVISEKVQEQKSLESIEILKERHRHEKRLAEIRHKHIQKQIKRAEREKKRLLSTLLEERGKGNMYSLFFVIVITIAVIIFTAKSKNRLMEFKTGEKEQDKRKNKQGMCLASELLP